MCNIHIRLRSSVMIKDIDHRMANILCPNSDGNDNSLSFFTSHERNFGIVHYLPMLFFF